MVLPKILKRVLLPALASFALTQPVQAASEHGNLAVALLQGLDKITARISTFEAPIDQPVRFGTFEITTRVCNKKPPEETPESAAFLEITEYRIDADPVPLFNGWMFASTPALSSVEHPVYDVWVIDCKKSSSSEAVNSQGN